MGGASASENPVEILDARNAEGISFGDSMNRAPGTLGETSGFRPLCWRSCSQSRVCFMAIIGLSKFRPPEWRPSLYSHPLGTISCQSNQTRPDHGSWKTSKRPKPIFPDSLSGQRRVRKSSSPNPVNRWLGSLPTNPGNRQGAEVFSRGKSGRAAIAGKARRAHRGNDRRADRARRRHFQGCGCHDHLPHREMRILLDSHILLWWMDDPQRLG